MTSDYHSISLEINETLKNNPDSLLYWKEYKELQKTSRVILSGK